MTALLGRLVDAQNSLDAERFASYFADDYLSEQPAHPGRGFTGRAQVLANWRALFAGVPDFRAELVASCVDGDTEWGEVRWSGHHTDGSVFAMCGVMVVRVRDDRIAAARLYVEPVEAGDQDIVAAVEELSGSPGDAG